MLPRFKAAAIHAVPIFLDKQATTKKAISLIREAAVSSRATTKPGRTPRRARSPDHVLPGIVPCQRVHRQWRR